MSTPQSVLPNSQDSAHAWTQTTSFSPPSFLLFGPFLPPPLPNCPCFVQLLFYKFLLSLPPGSLPDSTRLYIKFPTTSSLAPFTPVPVIVILQHQLDHKFHGSKMFHIHCCILGMDSVSITYSLFCQHLWEVGRLLEFPGDG